MKISHFFLIISLVLNVILLCSISSIESQKTIVLFFDDGWQSHYDLAFPILKEYGFHATFGIVTQQTNDLKGLFMTSEEILELYSNGMEIASHSHSHTSLLLLNSIEILSELRISKSILENTTSGKVETFIVPYNKWNLEISNLILQVYKQIRPKGTIEVENGFIETIEDLRLFLDNRKEIFLCYHSFTEMNGTDLETFKSHMKYFYENNYKVISYQEYLQN